MEDSLTCLGAAVGHHTEIGQAQLLGDLADGLKALGHHSGVFRGDLAAGGHMLLGDHQEVGGCLRVDVIEGVDGFVLINLLRGDVPCDELAE